MWLHENISKLEEHLVCERECVWVSHESTASASPKVLQCRLVLHVQVALREGITNETLQGFLDMPRPSWSRVRWINIDGMSWDVIQVGLFWSRQKDNNSVHIVRKQCLDLRGWWRSTRHVAQG